MSLKSLLNRCQTSSTSALDTTIVTGKYHTLDVAQLRHALSNVDREFLAVRRRRFNQICQEAKLDEEPGKGLSFQRTLLLLAHYQLIDENEALS